MQINKKMANDHVQHPTIDKVFRRIGHKKYFTTLDTSDAFWQNPIERGIKKITGFLFDSQT